MINVLYVCSTLKRTGPSNQLLNIIRNLPDSYNVTVCTLSLEPQDTLKPDFEKSGIKVVSLAMSRLKGVFFLGSCLNTLVNEFKPDVIHSQGIRSDYLVAKLKYKTYKVATLRNYPQLDYPSTYGRILGGLMTKVHTCNLKKLDLVVAVSDGVSKNLNKHFGVLNIVVIRNGVNTDTFTLINESEKLELRERLKLPKDKKIWISVGHLSARKNPLNIIESFKDYLKFDSESVLIFVGDGPLMQDCLGYADDNIIFTGRVSNVKDYLNSADYFISASRAEGFPNTVLESLASGVPVLLSDIPPHMEFFDLNEKIGQIFYVNENFHKVMMSLSKQDYSTLQLEAISVISNHLSASIMSSRYERIYRERGTSC